MGLYSEEGDYDKILIQVVTVLVINLILYNKKSVGQH